MIANQPLTDLLYESCGFKSMGSDCNGARVDLGRSQPYPDHNVWTEHIRPNEAGPGNRDFMGVLRLAAPARSCRSRAAAGDWLLLLGAHS